MIQASGLKKQFGDFTAVHDIELSLEQGDVFALIGPNGAGKTTLLRMLAGLLTPTAGKILLNGKELYANQRSYYQKLGFMPDVYSLYEDLTVWEFLDFFATCHLLKGEQKVKKIHHVIELVDLTIKQDEMIQGLSKGMKQRLLLAKTLLSEPDILLLDEPAAGLDPKARIDLRNIIKYLQQEGKTIIVSSHILSELADFCNAYGIMEKGQFVKTGKFGEFQEHKTNHVLYIEVLEQVEKLEVALKEFPITLLAKDKNKLKVEFVGERKDLVQLNQQLVESGLPIIGFFEKQENIEDVFMKYSQHEVS